MQVKAEALGTSDAGMPYYPYQKGYVKARDTSWLSRSRQQASQPCKHFMSHQLAVHEADLHLP